MSSNTFYDLAVSQWESSIEEGNLYLRMSEMKIIMQARDLVSRSASKLHELFKLFSTGFYTTNDCSRFFIQEKRLHVIPKKAELIAQPAMRFNLREIEMSVSVHMVAA